MKARNAALARVERRRAHVDVPPVVGREERRRALRPAPAGRAAGSGEKRQEQGRERPRYGAKVVARHIEDEVNAAGGDVLDLEGRRSVGGEADGVVVRAGLPGGVEDRAGGRVGADAVPREEAQLAGRPGARHRDVHGEGERGVGNAAASRDVERPGFVGGEDRRGRVRTRRVPRVEEPARGEDVVPRRGGGRKVGEAVRQRPGLRVGVRDDDVDDAGGVGGNGRREGRRVDDDLGRRRPSRRRSRWGWRRSPCR